MTATQLGVLEESLGLTLPDADKDAKSAYPESLMAFEETLGAGDPADVY